MSNIPHIVLGDNFAAMHQLFKVNTAQISNVLAEIGLADQEIGNFKICFEDEFVISAISRLRFERTGLSLLKPGRGWVNAGENAIHVTGLDDEGSLFHKSPEEYGQTILHEIGHVAIQRKLTPPSSFKREERMAERFIRKNKHVVSELVDYVLNPE
ncbi:MAG TPA: hypothetical protein VF996_02920 [Candidatus Saccharimonadales bacterium]|jgi:hypothetical protein